MQFNRRIHSISAILSALVLLFSAPIWAATHFLNPTGDVTQDGDNIQAAIDAASPGDVIRLGTGKFVLGKYLDEDTSWVSTSRGSFLYFSDFAVHDVRSPEINPFYWSSGGGPDTPPFPQVVVIDKPITIEASGPPGSTTFTTVNTWLDYPHSESLYNDANGFLIASSDVTIRGLRFENMSYGVRVISAGTSIEQNIFDTPGHYSLLYFMDDFAAYPDFPSRQSAVKSYLRQNTWLNAIQAIHMFGSEIEATDNYFEIKNSDSTEIPYSLWAIVFGGLPDFLDIPGVFSNSQCRNNVVQDNQVVGDERSWFGSFYFAGYGDNISGNTIADNTIESMYAMVESYGYAPVEDNAILGNKVTGGPLLFSADSFGVLLDAFPNSPNDNVFSHNQFVDVSAPMIVLAGESNLLQRNHYKKSDVPGWVAGGYGSIFLGPETSGNYVLDEKFPEGTECDQILDLGIDNVIFGTSSCD